MPGGRPRIVGQMGSCGQRHHEDTLDRRAPLRWSSRRQPYHSSCQTTDAIAISLMLAEQSSTRGSGRAAALRIPGWCREVPERHHSISRPGDGSRTPANALARCQLRQVVRVRNRSRRSRNRRRRRAGARIPRRKSALPPAGRVASPRSANMLQGMNDLGETVARLSN